MKRKILTTVALLFAITVAFAGTPSERLIETAVRGMLPKNRLGRRLFTKLKVYREAEHPHTAQHAAAAHVDWPSKIYRADVGRAFVERAFPTMETGSFQLKDLHLDRPRDPDDTDS